MSSTTTLQTYLALLDRGEIHGAEECLIQQLSTIGYGKLVWHLWRFRRFSPLEPIRASLFEKFNNGVALP